MVLKKFYLEHCTESLKGKLRKWVSGEPMAFCCSSIVCQKIMMEFSTVGSMELFGGGGCTNV